MNPVGDRKARLRLVAGAASGAGQRAPRCKRFSITAARHRAAVATLSGGNQQKVVVARWMEAKVRLLVLEEPTIGVDVGSKAEIYHLLQLSLKAGHGGAADLLGFRGGGAHLPSRAGLQPRPRRRAKSRAAS